MKSLAQPVVQIKEITCLIKAFSDSIKGAKFVFRTTHKFGFIRKYSEVSSLALQRLQKSKKSLVFQLKASDL